MKTPRIIVAFIAALTIAGCAQKQAPKEDTEAFADMPQSDYVVRCGAGPAANVNDFLAACRQRTLQTCKGEFDITAVYGEVKKPPYWIVMGVNCRKGIAL